MADTQYLVIDEIPKGFVPLDDSVTLLHGGSDSNFFGPCDVLLYFANLEKDESQKKALTHMLLPIYSSCESKEQREKSFLLSVSSIMPQYVAKILASNISYEIDSCKERFPRETFKSFLVEFVLNYCDTAKTYVEQIVDPDKEIESPIETDTGTPELVRKTNREALIGALDFNTSVCTMYYRPILGKCKGKFAFLNGVEISDVTTAFNLAIMEILSSDLHIRVCENCGNYFIPASRSDEIYCNRILPSGKTCKMVGYENKVKDDIILREYRKIYKTQHARKQRYKGDGDISERFNGWKGFADYRLAACQTGAISLDEMIASISGKEWMEQDI